MSDKMTEKEQAILEAIKELGLIIDIEEQGD